MSLGSCCACEKTNETVRNIITLELKSPIPGQGWGCFVCHLPPDGATAVVCDECIADAIDLKFACVGYPGNGKRVPIEQLEGEHCHNTRLHPEAEVINLDWDAAYRHFQEVRKSYQEYIGTPGVNTARALAHVFLPIAQRYQSGERTQELYDLMMESE